jgi:hypothetical protein
MKTPSITRSQSNLKKISSTRPKLSAREKQQQQTVSPGLAICLLGNYKTGKMFDSEYEEEVRKQAVMQVSLFPSRPLFRLLLIFSTSLSFSLYEPCPRAIARAPRPSLVLSVDQQEVLPDAIMWKKWEATEAPLRQGRGWYPTLVCPPLSYAPT